MLFPVVEVTRSLSNLIKYTFVNFDKEDSYVIDYEKKEKPVEEPELQMTQVPDPEGFEAGVPVKNFDQVWEEKQEEAREQARVVLEEADKEAAQILEQARQEADDVRQQAFDQGFLNFFFLHKGKETGKLRYLDDDVVILNYDNPRDVLEKDPYIVHVVQAKFVHKAQEMAAAHQLVISKLKTG